MVDASDVLIAAGSSLQAGVYSHVPEYVRVAFNPCSLPLTLPRPHPPPPPILRVILASAHYEGEAPIQIIFTQLGWGVLVVIPFSQQ